MLTLGPTLGALLMIDKAQTAPCLRLLAAALALPLTGCATHQFVRTEITRSEDALRPAVEQLASVLQEHQARVRELAAETMEARRGGEEATRGAIEALGMADVANGRAADAVDHATIAETRAAEAAVAGEQARAVADETAERLARLWRSGTKPSVVEAVVVRFRVDEWVPDDQARATLRDVAVRLQENRALVVELEGYADSAGAPPYNLRLSQLRAGAVARFLVEQGVETHRVQMIGLGTARPIADNTTADGRRQNRRVVLRLLDPF
jgi:outer membrane protein OmpA-like peptidoglycan-associated protein